MMGMMQKSERRLIMTALSRGLQRVSLVSAPICSLSFMHAPSERLDAIHEQPKVRIAFVKALVAGNALRMQSQHLPHRPPRTQAGPTPDVSTANARLLCAPGYLYHMHGWSEGTWRIMDCLIHTYRAKCLATLAAHSSLRVHARLAVDDI
jgi:hypothetical protein